MRQRLLRLAEALIAGGVWLLFALARLLPVEWTAGVAGRVARAIGPRLAVSRVARDNLARAFPEKEADERARILAGAWDNLGRTAAEYPYLGSLWDYDPERPELARRIEIVGAEQFVALRDDGRPGIVFAAHLANWELLAVAAARHGLEVAVLYREPNNPFVARLVRRIRGRHMGRLIPTDLAGGVQLVHVLRQGGHVGMLVDQHFSRGAPGTFFGQPVRTAPVLAKLAREFGCPVHGARVERLPGERFRLTLTPPLNLAFTGDNAADERAAMDQVNRVIEGWVRERPEDWLWMHRRWRPDPPARTASPRSPPPADS